MNPEWLKPSNAYGWRAVIRNVLPLLALLLIAPQLAHRSGFAPWLLSPVIGLFLYRITVVMHDCTHHTLFESRWLNRVVGVLDRILLYDVNFNYHAEHHAHPHIPSCHLSAVHRAACAPPGPGSMFDTLRAIYESNSPRV